MKKQLKIFASLLLISGIAFAQTGSLKKADKLFEMKAYVEAASLYETKEKTQEVLQNLGDSYYYNSNFEKAIETYENLFLNHGDSIDVEFHFKYAQALKGVKNYTEADKHLSKYYNKTINTPEFIALNAKTTPHVFRELTQISGGIDSNADFALSYYGDDEVVFASSRASKKQSFSMKKSNYFDLYKATLSSSGVLENTALFSKAINTGSHESNAVFTKDGKTVYFNRTDEVRIKTDEAPVAHIKIFKAELVDDSWTNIKALSFNSNTYSAEHPALSDDEKTLYFASDMPGTYGGFDIFKVSIHDDGTYGEPENLGDKINTKHREQFPFMSNNVLYFASDGHLNFGGLDVFRSDLVNGIYKTPVNLGATINSNRDDFAYTVREKDDTGFISSNRDGQDRLYSFVRTENILTPCFVKGTVHDKNNNELLAGSVVILLDENNYVLQDTVVEASGAYKFDLRPDKTYKLKVTHKAYIPQELTLTTNTKGELMHEKVVYLEAFVDAEEQVKETEKGDVQVQLDKIYFDFNASTIREDATVTLNVLVDLMKKYPSMEVEVSAHTDVRGPDEYNLTLSKQRAASTLEYLVSQGIERKRLKSEGYGEQRPLNDCIKEGICSDKDYDVNRRCEFTILN